MVQLLFGTIPFYADRESRLAVQSCLITILKSDVEPKLLGSLIKGLRQEAQKPVIAVSTSFVLVEWCSLLMQILAGTDLWDQFGNDILLCDADSFEQCLQPTSKRSIANSATVVTRRGFRELFSPAKSRKQTLTTAVKTLTAKGSQGTAKFAPLLGVIAGVSWRLQALKPILDSLKPQFYEFYTREIVSSKTPIARHVAIGMRDFFSDFATLEEVERDVVPALEKGLLRAPEVILTGVLRPFISSLPRDFDLSLVLKGRLLKPLLSSIKSSNPQVRAGAVASFRDIVSRCHDDKALESVVEEVLNPLKGGKLSSPEHRVLHAEMLEGMTLPGSSAEKVSVGVATVAAKEGNEPALLAETSTLARTVSQILTQGAEVQQPVLDTIAKGLADKKPNSRKLWLLLVAQVLRGAGDGVPTQSLNSFLESVIPALVDNFNEVVANPATAVQSGVIVGAYILTALSPSIRQRFPQGSANQRLTQVSASQDSIAARGKQAFLLSPRIYTKLSAKDDLRWFTLSVSSLAALLNDKTEKETILSWSETMIYLITATDIPPEVQRETARSLFQVYSENPGLVAEAIMDGLWNLLLNPTAKEKEFKVGNENFLHVLKSICPEVGEDNYSGVSIGQREDQACALLVLGRTELVPRSSWITLCLRMGVDPGNLSRKYQDRLLQEIGRRALDGSVSSGHTTHQSRPRKLTYFSCSLASSRNLPITPPPNWHLFLLKPWCLN